MPGAGVEPAAEPRRVLTDVLQEFATSVAGDVIRSLASEMAAAAGSAPPWEALAGDLASAAVETGLTEASGGGSHLRGSNSAKMDGVSDSRIAQSGRIRPPPDSDPSNKSQILDESQPPSQLGLPTVGSLDYPDAPPTTPLFPELQRSRSSFARKLKGGLAKVFLPSPPPPTPKDEDVGVAGLDLDPRAELMEHLTLSLTTWDPYDERPHGGAGMEALAEALSGDIIGRALLSAGEHGSDHPAMDVHLQAHWLAENILASSLDEVRMMV